MAQLNPPRLRVGGLSGEVYIVTHGKEITNDKGTFLDATRKYKATDDFKDVALELGWQSPDDPLRAQVLELALRLADVHATIEGMTSGLDEDQMEAIEGLFPHGGFFSVVDYALRGDPGHGDEEEAEERRQKALDQHHEYLGL
jgi:hypothetical protein